MVEETNLDTQTSVYYGSENITDCEFHQTLQTSSSCPKFERRRCKVISCKNMFLVFLTVTVLGTLTGVLILYFGFSTTANGGWSDWGKWSTCTVTCGGGIQSRSRTCTNPRPSPHGKYCEGDPMEVVLCNKVTCSPNIVFKAKGVTDKSPAGQTIIFGTTLANEGNAYNTSTGVFTAPVNGTYSFSTQLCVDGQHYLFIAFIVDGATYDTAYIYDKDSDLLCDTADTVAVLHEQSKVWVKCISASSGDIIYESSVRMSSFSGYLVHQ